MTSIGDNSQAALLARLREFRDARNWSQFHTPKDLAISIAVEAGELLELFQWRPADEAITDELKNAIRGEAADVLLYLLQLADRFGFDLLQAGHDKVTLNEERFPVPTSVGIAKPDDATKRK